MPAVTDMPAALTLCLLCLCWPLAALGLWLAARAAYEAVRALDAWDAWRENRRIRRAPRPF